MEDRCSRVAGQLPLRLNAECAEVNNRLGLVSGKERDWFKGMLHGQFWSLLVGDRHSDYVTCKHLISFHCLSFVFTCTPLTLRVSVIVQCFLKSYYLLEAHVSIFSLCLAVDMHADHMDDGTGQRPFSLYIMFLHVSLSCMPSRSKSQCSQLGFI